MAILNSSGNKSSSENDALHLLEKNHIAWHDLDARSQEDIIRHFSQKVKIMALRLKSKLPQSVELNDLLGSGTLGLMEALRKFDPSLGIKFDTYAENRIKGAMLDELRRHDWFSRGLRQKIRLLEQVIHKLEQRTGQAPSKEELQRETGLSQDEVEHVLESLAHQVCLSLDSLEEQIKPENKRSLGYEPFATTSHQELVDKLTLLVDELTNKEKMVLSLYYHEELTMKETAEVLEVTEGRVSQLHSQALSKLRKKFRQRFQETGS
jgi:RNA polymerase sigma factor for flagellar operon FliA